MTPTEIALIVAAVAFVIVAVFLAIFLYTTCQTMKKVTETLERVQEQLDALGNEPRDLIRNANEISEDINRKLKSFDPIFHTVARLGERIDGASDKSNITCMCNGCREKVRLQEEAEANPTMQGIELAARALDFWQNLKKRK